MRFHASNEDSDQPRPSIFFPGCTDQFVCFVVLWLIYLQRLIERHTKRKRCIHRLNLYRVFAEGKSMLCFTSENECQCMRRFVSPLANCFNSCKHIPFFIVCVYVSSCASRFWFKQYLLISLKHKMDRVKRIWYLSPMRAAKVQASLRIRAVSPEPPLLAHTSSESRGTFRQKARSLAPLNGWACAVEQLKFIMTECSKTQIRLRGPMYNDI